jgi:hypothetical protein
VFKYQEVRMMEMRTRRNGGNANVQAVAEAWHKEQHEFGWSTSQNDTWAVDYAKRLKAEYLKEGPVKPDPRNIHDD